MITKDRLISLFADDLIDGDKDKGNVYTPSGKRRGYSGLLKNLGVIAGSIGIPIISAGAAYAGEKDVDPFFSLSDDKRYELVLDDKCNANGAKKENPSPPRKVKGNGHDKPNLQVGGIYTPSAGGSGGGIGVAARYTSDTNPAVRVRGSLTSVSKVFGDLIPDRSKNFAYNVGGDVLLFLHRGDDSPFWKIYAIGGVDWNGYENHWENEAPWIKNKLVPVFGGGVGVKGHRVEVKASPREHQTHNQVKSYDLEVGMDLPDLGPVDLELIVGLSITDGFLGYGDTERGKNISTSTSLMIGFE